MQTDGSTPISERDISAHVAFLSSKVSVLVFLVKTNQGYDADRLWLPIQGLALRAIDDLFFSSDTTERVVVAFTAEPPHESGVRAIAVPLQAALERVFFHIQGVSKLVINPRSLPLGVSPLQSNVDFTLPGDFGDGFELSREHIAEAIGALACPVTKDSDCVSLSRAAYKSNSLFEMFSLARHARRATGDLDAWFLELMAMSFIGIPERAVELYELYPARDGADPQPLLLAARFRLLLKQFNEACTILHTLTFKDEVAAVAFTELARAFVMTGEFSRAVDAASTAIGKDPESLDARLVRGIALRGLSYDSGEEEGLKSALADFEYVAKNAVFNAAEALFHAGTIFARLGDLVSAESSLRQSLFQRDRFASRDALIRVVCAAGKMTIAREETSILERLIPHLAKPLREVIDAHTNSTREGASAEGEGEGELELATALWSSDRQVVVRAARQAFSAWGISLAGTPADARFFDEFLSYYAPAGRFSEQLEYSQLNVVGLETVGRAIAAHLAQVFIDAGVAHWREVSTKSVVLTIPSSGGTVPLESFVNERILLGCSADNFSCLESLAAELCPYHGGGRNTFLGDKWESAGVAEQSFFESEAKWAHDKLQELGAILKHTLSDLSEIDRCIDSLFEPGGELSERGGSLLGNERDRFVAAVGFLIGDLIRDLLPATWSKHPDLEGVSLFTAELGRIFPVARVQRRIYLATAADFSLQLGSFAFGVGAAAVAHEVQRGKLQDAAQIRGRLIDLLPALETFPEAELDSLVQSLEKQGRTYS